VKTGLFTPFDGATMYHDDEAKLQLFDRGMKQKGHGKKKYLGSTAK